MSFVIENVANDLSRIIRAHRTELSQCYRRSLQADPAASGDLTVAFSIDADGKVPSATLTTDTVSKPALAKCVVKAFQRWKFPRPRGTTSVDVVQVLNLGEAARRTKIDLGGGDDPLG